VTDLETNDFIVIQGLINMDEFVDKSKVDDNVSVSECLSSDNANSKINIVVQSSATLVKIRNFSKLEEFVKNPSVRVYNDNGDDLGTVTSDIPMSTSHTDKTMLRSIKLHSDELTTNVIKIDNYKLLTKYTVPSNLMQKVVEDFNKFIENNADKRVIVLFRKDIYEILKTFKLFEKQIDGFRFDSVELQKLSEYAYELSHSRRVIETEQNYNVKISVENYTPYYVKPEENSKMTAICRSNSMEFMTKSLNKVNVLAFFKKIKNGIDSISTVIPFECASDAESVEIIKVMDMNLGIEIATVSYSDLLEETEVIKNDFTKFSTISDVLTNLTSKYYKEVDKTQLIVEIENFLTLNDPLFAELKLLYNNDYSNSSKMNEDTKILYQETRQILFGIFKLIYTVASYVKDNKMMLNNLETNKKNEILETEFESIYGVYYSVEQELYHKDIINVLLLQPQQLTRYRSVNDSK